jgi:CRISPR associated protein Cas1
LYAVLESEARLALAALGLDPGIGVLHRDLRARDSLACDLMEPIRPQVDAYLLDWLFQEPLNRHWFCEQRDGNCRLVGSFTVQLSQTANIWKRALAPFAEGIAKALSEAISKSSRSLTTPTHLTQGNRRAAKVLPQHPRRNCNQGLPRPVGIVVPRLKRVQILSGLCTSNFEREYLDRFATWSRQYSHARGPNSPVRIKASSGRSSEIMEQERQT